MKRIKEKDFLFFTAYCIYIFVAILNYSFYAKTIEKIIRPLIYICLIILLIKEMTRRKTDLKEIIFFIVCMVLTFLMIHNKNEPFLVYPMFIFLFESRDIEFKKIAKVTIIESLILLIAIVISSKLGIINNFVYSNEGRVREYLGFRYSLLSAKIMFNITSLMLYINKKINIKKLIFLVFINTYIFYYTNSRLSFFLSIVLIMLFFIKDNITLKKIAKKILENKSIKIIICSSYIITLVFSLFLTMNYNYKLEELNIILEYRLSLGQQSLQENPITLFGSKIKFYGAGLDYEGNRSEEDYNFVDCLYINVLQKFGLVFLVLFIFMQTYTIICLYREKDYKGVVIFLFISICSLIDNLALYIWFNTFLFLNNKCSYDAMKQIKNKEKCI